MADQDEGKLHIDSDWKEEAAREKERLKAMEQDGAPGPEGEAGVGFVELLNLLAVQAAVSLGGMQTPGGETVPPNPQAAKHFIDMLEVLDQKTQGNLTDEESRLLTSVLYELRMQFVQAVQGPGAAAPPPSEGTD